MTESLCCTLLLFVCVFADEKNVTVQSGQNITLPCRALNTIIGVEWSRPDLNEEYVLLYRDGHFNQANQHPSFVNRVDLQDRQMKDGDLSLILKDVTINDTGRYECRVLMNETKYVPSIIILTVVPPEKNVTAESGQNITLPCQALNTIIGVEWSRPDLNQTYVLLYRDGHFDPVNQHPSFKNRVELQDRKMKDGDVSLILKDVTTNDTGTYECRVRGENKSKNRAHLSGDPISIIYLRVVDPPGSITVGEKINAPFGLIITLSVFAVLLVGGF